MDLRDMTEVQVWAVAQPHVVAQSEQQLWVIPVQSDLSLRVACGGCAQAGSVREVILPKEIVQLQPQFGFLETAADRWVFCLGRDVSTETGCCPSCGWAFRIQQGRMIEAMT